MTRSHRILRGPATALAVAALLTSALAGCSDSGNAAASPNRFRDPQTSAATSAPPAPCSNPHGGECLGSLEPGRYETTVFQPGIRYTVPAGWVNGEDLPGNFLLYREDDQQEGFFGGSYIGIFADVRIPDGCEEGPDPMVGNKPADLVAWYVDHPGLATSHPRKVEVGGLHGLLIDVPLKKGYQGQCPWSEGHPVVPVIIGSGVSQLFHVSLHELDVRLVVLEWKDTNVVVEITSVKNQHSHQAWGRIVRPIIKSLKFGRG